MGRRREMLLKVFVILLVFSSSSGFHWGRTTSDSNPVLNRKQRAALMRWLPLYTWKYFRYDPWMLRHQGLWVHDLSRNKNVKLAAYKRRTMLAKEQRITPFVHKILKFIRKNKSDAANELFKPKYLPISRDRWVHNSEPVFDKFRISSPPPPFSPRHWPINRMRESNLPRSGAVNIGFGLSEFQNIPETNTGFHRYWNPPKPVGDSFVQHAPMFGQKLSEMLSVGFGTVKENIHKQLTVPPADFSDSIPGVNLHNKDFLTNSQSTVSDSIPSAGHLQPNDDSISDSNGMANFDSYIDYNNKSDNSVQTYGDTLSSFQYELETHNNHNQKEEVDSLGSYVEDGFEYPSWGPPVEHEHGFHVGHPSAVASISDISDRPEHSQTSGDIQGVFQENTFPIPQEGQFDEDTSNCEGIGTRRCNVDSECSCYGLYTCTDGRCSSTSTQGSDDVFGGFWHDGPVDIK